jgi:hypothetical protein
MTVKLTPLNIAQLDANLDTEYWIGAPFDAVTSFPTICAEVKTPLAWWHYNGYAWVKISQFPWRSRPGITIRKFGNPIFRDRVVSDQRQTDTLLGTSPTGTRIEISGDGSTYFINDLTEWKAFVAANEWVSVASLSTRLAPSFDGSAVCAIAQDSNSVDYIKPNRPVVTVSVSGTDPTFAGIIDSVVIVARGSTVDSFVNGILRNSFPVRGPAIGVYTDDESVWVATSTGTSYVSFNKGVNWLQLNNMRVVAPWIVIQNGYLFEVATDPGQTGPSGCSGADCGTAPTGCSGESCVTGPTGCSGPSGCTGPTGGPTGPKSNTLTYVAIGVFLLAATIAFVWLVNLPRQNKKTAS